MYAVASTLVLTLITSFPSSAFSLPARAICPPVTSWPPPVTTIEKPFSISITSVPSPSERFSLSLSKSPNLPGYITNLTSPLIPGPLISLTKGRLLYDGLIFSRNHIEDTSTRPKDLLFLPEANVQNGGFLFEAVYVCDVNGVERRVLKKVSGVGTEVISASAWKEGAGLVAVIQEGEVLKPEIWLEIV